MKNKFAAILNQQYPTYLNEIKKYKTVSLEEERSLFGEYRNGSIKARDKLIKHNLRFLIYMLYPVSGIDPMDLLSDATESLIVAIEAFDHTRGSRVISYAKPIIKRRLLRFIMNQAKDTLVSYSDTIMYIGDSLEDVETVNNLLHKLTREEERFLGKLFGIYGYSAMRQRDLAKEMGLSMMQLQSKKKKLVEKLSKILGDYE